ncbi:MAG: DNA-deoxyinosine glycosylase [Treponemataceae bacterium]|nr:DNA-deoxyinosine glycosylase [Treponemataceae bacterium]
MKVKSSDYQHIIHPFPALYDGESRVLILGSLPSVKSREQNFFYGHPQNRFWKVISSIFSTEEPETIEDKKILILHNHLALWDTIFSCDIIGSADSTIKNVVPTDLNQIISDSKIERIYCNGKTSGKYFSKFQEKNLKIKAEILPSTSPANAAFSLEKLIEEWSVIKTSS